MLLHILFKTLLHFFCKASRKKISFKGEKTQPLFFLSAPKLNLMACAFFPIKMNSIKKCLTLNCKKKEPFILEKQALSEGRKWQKTAAAKPKLPHSPKQDVFNVSWTSFFFALPFYHLWYTLYNQKKRMDNLILRSFQNDYTNIVSSAFFSKRVVNFFGAKGFFSDYVVLPPRQIKSTVRLCQRIKSRIRKIQTFDQNNS